MLGSDERVEEVCDVAALPVRDRLCRVCSACGVHGLPDEFRGRSDRAEVGQRDVAWRSLLQVIARASVELRDLDSGVDVASGGHERTLDRRADSGTCVRQRGGKLSPS